MAGVEELGEAAGFGEEIICTNPFYEDEYVMITIIVLAVGEIVHESSQEPHVQIIKLLICDGLLSPYVLLLVRSCIMNPPATQEGFIEELSDLESFPMVCHVHPENRFHVTMDEQEVIEFPVGFIEECPKQQKEEEHKETQFFHTTSSTTSVPSEHEKQINQFIAPMPDEDTEISEMKNGALDSSETPPARPTLGTRIRNFFRRIFRPQNCKPRCRGCFSFAR